MSASTTYADGRRRPARRPARGAGRATARLTTARLTTGALALVLTLAACSSDADDQLSPGSSPGSAAGSPTAEARPAPGEPGSTTPGPDATPVPVPDEVAARAEDGVTDYVSDVGDALADPTTEDELTLDAVTGAALEELRNRVAEYQTSGWRVVGAPKVVRHRVVRYYDDPPIAVVRACIDNSRVRVVDADGAVVPGSRPAKARTLNILTLVEVDGSWAVGEQRLATKPDC